MRVVVQKTINANCVVDGKETGKSRLGYTLLVGFCKTDDLSNVKKMAKKVCNLRIFSDEFGKMNLSINDVGGTILSISQFTLYADASEGNRPSFTFAMEATRAKDLYDEFNEELKNLGLHVECGVFQTHMEVTLTNDGPVTILLEN